MMNTSRNLKRFRAVIITILLVIFTNIAISYAGNLLTKRSGTTILPDGPRPRSGTTILPDGPRP